MRLRQRVGPHLQPNLLCSIPQLAIEGGQRDRLAHGLLPEQSAGQMHRIVAAQAMISG